jgi:hypothetical protein
MHPKRAIMLCIYIGLRMMQSYAGASSLCEKVLREALRGDRIRCIVHL